MALDTYNPISIIAALLANSSHRLHSTLSHPHIRCNPHQLVPAGVPGWGSWVKNSSLHWHPQETEQRIQISASLNTQPWLKSSLYQLCGLRKGWMQHILPLHLGRRSLYQALFPPIRLRFSCSSQAFPAQLQQHSTQREQYLPSKQHLKQHKPLRKQPPAFSLVTWCWWQGDTRKPRVSTVWEQQDKLRNSSTRNNCKLL